ncbi:MULTISPECIES: hypothetical protein [Clostridium]|uniref:Uncharacterized protein n=1 Tax=Clostridium frigoriphilum TaxID=443253 RepID=A0ABU7UUF7_9CLOT|nr:hypothetical protein [Clostridium sp. DSM 17811]MBU3101696.1 hypothetical protein [Clostridium sp. DSM 17811]
MKHKWTENDDIAGLYLYLYKENMLDKKIENISDKLGMSLSSLKMKISNFKSIAKGKGLDHASAQSVEVYKNYCGLNKIEFAKLVNNIIK